MSGINLASLGKSATPAVAAKETFKVKHFINVSLCGFETAIRVYDTVPKGINATQKEIYQLLIDTPSADLEQFFKHEGAEFLVTSVRAGEGKPDADVLDTFRATLASFIK